jgi:hypothetical protein
VSPISATPEPANPALASANRRIVARWVDVRLPLPAVRVIMLLRDKGFSSTVRANGS